MFKRLFAEKEMKCFAIILFIVGIFMSVLVSPWQIPDEQAHLNMIGNAIENENFAANITASLGMDQGRIEWTTSESTSMEQWLSAMVKQPDYEMIDMLPKGINLSGLKHLPAVIGMELAIVLQLPTYWVLQFGELFSLLVYILICCKALKKCPFKKGVMAVFMLSPMMMQGASSYSYDALVIPFIYWIICYVFHLRYEKNEITLKDILLLVIPWLWLTYIKVPYVFIVLLGLMLPIGKFHVQFGNFEIDEEVIKKYRWIAFVVAVIGIVIGVYLLRNNYWINIVLGLAAEWRRTLYLLYSTAITFAGHLIVSSVGNFGWLNAPVSDAFGVLFYVVLFGMALVGNDGSAKRISKWDRGTIWITFILLALMTLFSMVNHTIMITLYGSESAGESYEIRKALYQIPYIGGLQGRYFMPFVSLFFMQFGSVEKLDRNKTKIVWTAFLLITYIYVGYILVNRFWI